MKLKMKFKRIINYLSTLITISLLLFVTGCDDDSITGFQPNKDMPKAYNPKLSEQRIYEFWMSEGYFTPKIDLSKKPFVLIMPPPNVTGELHMGHALTAALEDLMVRWNRMLYITYRLRPYQCTTTTKNGF